MYLPAVLILLLATGSVSAQETTVTVSDEIAEQARADLVEASSDLRESINENLETVQEDAEVAAEIREQQEERPTSEPQQAEGLSADNDTKSAPDNTAEPTPDEAGAQQPAGKKSYFDHIRSMPALLQSVPERVPFIRDRGLIFFGRVVLTGIRHAVVSAYSTSGHQWWWRR